MAEPIRHETPRTSAITDALTGRRPKSVPFWFMRQAGRYLPEYRKLRAEARSFLDLVYAPELAAEVTLQPIRRFGMDAAILFSDILVIPDGLGQKVWFETGEGPRLEPITDTGALDALSAARAREHLRPVLETVRRVKGALGPETALLGFAGAPWTVATYMVAGRGSADQAAAKKWAFGDPEGFASLIDLLVDATADYLIAQAHAGADAVQIFDSWAGALPAPAFGRWCVDPVHQIVAKFKASCPETPVIGFPRGAGASYAGYAEATGVDAVGLDTTVPVGWAHETLPAGLCVQGNLDPILLVAGGAAMIEAAKRIIDGFRERPHIFNLGHGITPEVPPEHVTELCEVIRDHGAS